MTQFCEFYNADMSRYESKPDIYVRMFLYFGRRTMCSKFYPIKLLYKLLFRLLGNMRGMEISTLAKIERGLYLGHAWNITINPAVEIGYNCNIHKGVVIGRVNRGEHEGVPTIGNKVWIGINSAIVGKINIGDDVLIAPNSFVNVDVPSHSIVFGNPCVIKHRENATEHYVNNCYSSNQE